MLSAGFRPIAGDSYIEIEAYTTSAKLVKGFILVEAQVDDHKGLFVLDTGAPGLILNQRYYKGRPCEEFTASGLSDGFSLNQIQLKRFKWLSIKKRNTKVHTIDLSNLEHRTGRKIEGLIGYDVIKKYELLIDYEQSIVQLFPAKKSLFRKNKKALLEVPIHFKAHLPVISLNINDQEFQLGIDSGAENNIIHNGKMSSENKREMVRIRKHEVRGLDKKIRQAHVVKFSGTSIRHHELDDMPFLLMDASYLKNNPDLQLDGLLGFPFLNRGRVSINYYTHKLSFWE